MLIIDDIIERKNDVSLVFCGQGEEKQKNEKIAKKYVIRNLSDEVMHTISASDPFVAIRKFYAAYGFDRTNPSVIESKLRNISCHPNQNHSIMLNQIDVWTAELESARGAITYSRLVQLLVDGLTGNPFKDNFWFNCRGQMMLKGLKNYKYDSAAKFTSQYWYAYKLIKKHDKESINMSNNPQEYKRTRNIQVRNHFVRDLVKENKIRLVHAGTADQLADFFTKGISGVHVRNILSRLGIHMPPKHGRESKRDAIVSSEDSNQGSWKSLFHLLAQMKHLSHKASKYNLLTLKV
jgi:hypothetical protein